MDAATMEHRRHLKAVRNRRYRQSEKGRISSHINCLKYYHSEKGQANRKRYVSSEEFKAGYRAYKTKWKRDNWEYLKARRKFYSQSQWRAEKIAAHAI